MIQICDNYYAKRGDLILHVMATYGPTDVLLFLNLFNDKECSEEVYYNGMKSCIFCANVEAWGYCDSFDGNWVVT